MIIMNSFIIISLCLLLLLFSPAFSLPQLQPSSSPDHDQKDLSFEEKTRLGSIPLSCHNKCNGCHPCMAVQVPMFTAGGGGAHDRFRPGLSKAITATDDDSMQFFDTSTDQYSNYKPLSWKCRCGDHFYNP